MSTKQSYKKTNKGNCLEKIHFTYKDGLARDFKILKVEKCGNEL